MSLSTLFALVCQLPALAPQNPPAALDVVELKNGDTIAGRVTIEIDGYLELELEAGATLGLSTAQVAAVRRGVAPPPAANAAVRPRSEWFVMHDATGQAVGWLQSAITQRVDGGFTVNEEYEFQIGVLRYQVTAQATADARGAARRSYYRERISEPILATLSLPAVDAAAAHDRVVDERIVEAVVHGDRLFVRRLAGTGRGERDLAWPASSSFPLLARVFARTNGTSTGAVMLFDPASEEFVVHTYDGRRQRSVMLGGKTVQVTEVAETSATGRNAEWIDASAHTLRREIAGPALVAVPSSAGSARLAVGATKIPGAIAAEAGGSFGLWVPNPAWVVREDAPPGQVVLVNEANDASVSLTRLDHLAASTPLDAAVDAVANWFALLQPELAVRGREVVRVRERAAMRLSAVGRRAHGPVRACLDVIPHQGHFLVLTCIAPEPAWDELAGDFAFLSRTIELDAQSLAPKLQGPLAQRAKKGQSPNTRPKSGVKERVGKKPGTTAPRRLGPAVPGKAPAVSAEPAAAPLVRIPNDG